MSVVQTRFQDGRKYMPGESRGYVAQLLDACQPELLAALMNYESGSNQTISEFPCVHFRGYQDGFALLGYGEKGEELVGDVSPLIFKAMAERSDRVIQVETKKMAMDCEIRPYKLEYTVGKIVVQKKAHHRELLNDPVAGKAHIEALFLRSLERNAEAAGVVLPDGIQVELLGAKNIFAAKNGEGRPALMGVNGAVFAVNARLTGIWSVGYLLSKGYGQFNATAQLGGAQ